MSELKPEKIDLLQINSGKKYKNGDVVDAKAINSAVQASAYAQALATNEPNVVAVSASSTPKVVIEELVDGSPRLKFELPKNEKDPQVQLNLVEIQNNRNEINKSKNKIDALYGVLNYKQITQVAEDVPNNKAFRQTGEYSYFDEDLLEDVSATLDVVDGSYTKVTKIEGKGTLSGIKSTGRNLFPSNELLEQKQSTSSANGLIATFSEKGILISGTPLKTTRAFLINARLVLENPLPAGDYVLSGCPSGGSFNTHSLQLVFGFADGSQDINKTVFESPVSISLESTATEMYVNINIFNATSGVPVNLLFKPMITKGTKTYPYQPVGIESIMTLPEPLTLEKFEKWENGKIYSYRKYADLNIDWQVDMTDESWDDELGEFVGGNNITLFSATNFTSPEDIDIGIPDEVTGAYDNPIDTTITKVYDGVEYKGKISYSADENKFYMNMTPALPMEEMQDFLVTSGEVIYRTLTPQSITDFTFDNEYQAWNGGTEEKIGDNLTVYNEYLVYFGEEEGGDK